MNRYICVELAQLEVVATVVVQAHEAARVRVGESGRDVALG